MYFPSRPAGFTLLEMLLALAILAIAIAGATLAMRPDEARQLANESERLALLLEQAQEEAQLGGMSIAWVAGEDRYEFQRRELTDSGPEWVVLRGDELLRPRTLPNGLYIRRLEFDGRGVNFGDRLNLQQPGSVRIELSMGEARHRILGNEAGYTNEAMAVGAP